MFGKNSKPKVKKDSDTEDDVYHVYEEFENQEEFDEKVSRVGKFRVTKETLLQEMKTMEVIFRDVFIIQVDHDALQGVITYLAISDKFEKTPARMMDNAPVYDITIDHKFDNDTKLYKYSFVKVFDGTASNSVH